MTNFRDPMAPYKGYFIMRIDRCMYYINRIINPEKENLKGKDAVYNLTWDDLVYIGACKYSLEAAHSFIRQHKKESKINNDTIWKYRERFRLASESDWDKLWEEAKAQGIYEELKTYIRLPIKNERSIIFF